MCVCVHIYIYIYKNIYREKEMEMVLLVHGVENLLKENNPSFNIPHFLRKSEQLANGLICETFRSTRNPDQIAL